MGALFRLAVLVLGVGFAACLIMHKTTGDLVWRQRAIQVLKWAVATGLVFFGVLILRRAAIFV